jgi:cell division protease FtsH
MKNVFGTIGYVIWHNRIRLVLLFAVLYIWILFAGSIQYVIAGIADFIGQLPGLLVNLAFILFFGIFQFFGIMWFLARPRTYTVTPDQPQIGLSFDNYRGQPDLVAHAKSLVRILKGVKRFEDLGGEPPKGMLLSGAPGTGKTFLAGVVAAEAGLPFMYADASGLRSMWLGVDALIIMQLFGKARKLARKYAPKGQRGACILFLDELDSIGMARGGMPGGQMSTTAGFMGFGGMGLNTLLNQMDSLGQHVEDRWGHKILRWLGVIRGPVVGKPLVFVMGATNRPDVLDPALVRPGRLDRRINVYPPDGEGRRDIITHYLSQKAHDPDVPVDLMVQDSVRWTPIMIKTIINEALIIAHDEGRDALTYKDWLHARDTRILGLKQPIANMLPDEKRAIAYHEAGHAVVAHYVLKRQRVAKASIIRMGDALGVVQPVDREEHHTLPADEIEADIMVSLGSRAVEELILGTKITGADGDLQSATAAALGYIAYHGMGPTLVSVPVSGVGQMPLPVIRVVDELLRQLMEETKRLIREKEFVVHAVASALLEKEELIGPELDDVFRYAELSHPDGEKAFERRPIVLRRPFEQLGVEEHAAIPAVASAAAATPEPPKQ